MQWKLSVKIGDLHDQYEKGELTLNEVATQFAARLVSKCSKDEYILDLAEELREVYDVAEYDEVLGRIYDYADRQRIWIDPGIY